MQRTKNILKKILIVILILLAVVAAGSGIYVNNYYHADTYAEEALNKPPQNVMIMNVENKRIVYAPEGATLGMIFYPGGKVQYEAYAPLMEKLSERGIFCVLLHMPCNLAVLDMHAAEGIQEEYPQISDWYIAGHSLGGAMAAYEVKDHAEDYQGLILLGAYSSVDIHDLDLETLLIYGSEDGVMNRETYEESRANLPDDYQEEVISGGCHAQFGSYGPQKHDGEPTISMEEQMDQTVDAIMQMINE